jgi:TPR repeat protein
MSCGKGNRGGLTQLKRMFAILPRWFSLFLFLASLPSSVRADALADGVRAYAAGNYTRSVRILMVRAEQGDARAETYLGVMYLRGQGVPQNFEAAADWLHRAAESGAPAAQYFLGLMYDKGEGVAQDFVLAQAWLNLAVAHAEPGWRTGWVLIRDAVASKMSRAELAEAQRLALDWRPASAP